LRHGRIIHGANGKDKVTTEEIPLVAYATRFPLAEEELEQPYIDRVDLKLELEEAVGVLAPGIGGSRHRHALAAET
jgi:hypothetical protein